MWVSAALPCSAVGHRGGGKSHYAGPASIGNRPAAALFVSLVSERLPDGASHEIMVVVTRPGGHREQVGRQTIAFTSSAAGHELDAPI